ncbi:PKD domain-containing protein [Methanoculleus sp.]|jgi:beta propeller repeat protein|uniref:PKD domain-containing protein n=1 Tax=Methanoculleus sp. TaxID=90427 RepID=UPI001BD6A885|nr:PKD domain-containing protein [Methanoculleus sp.]
MRKPRLPVIYLVVFIVAVISIAVIATAAPQAGTFTSGEPGMPGLSRALDVFPNNLSHADISGNRIVYSDYRNGNWDIFLFNHTSGREYQLTNDSYDQMNPTISCDLVAWYDNSTGVWDLVLLKLHGDDAAYAVCTGPDEGRPGCPAGVVCPPISTPTSAPTPGPGNCSCTANFTWSPQSPAVNDTVDFTDTTSIQGDCNAQSWAWDFGDNATGEGGTASHAYAVAGTYAVRLNVTLDDGTACNTSRDVTVVAVAPTPTPTVNVTPTPTVNVTPTPTMNVTPTPTVNVTLTLTPTANVTLTPTPTPSP